MRLTHPDYNKLVIASYHNMRLNNQLAPLLAKPTPANIRMECAHIYQERFDKKDEPMLRAFFGPPKKEGKFLEHIQEFDVDRFRPLDSFLKEEGKKSITDRHLNLLAWLIDFKYRPYSYGIEVFLTEEELQIITTASGTIDSGVNEPDPDTAHSSGDPKEPRSLTNTANNPQNPQTTKKEDKKEEKREGIIAVIISRIRGWGKIYKTVAIAFVSLLVSLGGIYLYRNYDRFLGVPFGERNTGCMYWAEDRYEQVPCNVNLKGRLIVAMDEEKLKNFRKITREDTITKWSIGKIYYLKNNQALEYFTTGGNHPVFVTRTLKVLSPYMFDKYLLANANKKP